MGALHWEGVGPEGVGRALDGGWLGLGLGV